MRYWSVILFLLVSNIATAQTREIDNLRSALPGSTGLQKIETLYRLAEHFYIHHVHSDSTLQYAEQVYAMAAAMKNKELMARAMVMQAQVKGRFLGKLPEMEMLSRKAIELLEHHDMSSTYLHALGCLGLSLIWQGRFDESMKQLNHALLLAERSGIKKEWAWINQLVGLAYLKHGHYWKSFEYLVTAMNLGKEIKDSLVVSFSLALIARAYNFNGDPRKAVDYYLESIKFKNSGLFAIYPHMQDLGYAYLKLKIYDSAVYYQQLQKDQMKLYTSDLKVRNQFNFWQNADFRIDAILGIRKYDEVLRRVLPELDRLNKQKNMLPFLHGLLNAALAYQGKGMNENGIKYARLLLSYSETTSNKYYRREALSLLAGFYENQNMHDSAFSFFRKYTLIKDSMSQEQFALRTALYTATMDANAKLELINKQKLSQENLLALQEKQIQKQSQMKNYLLLLLAVMFIFSFLVFRNIALKRKNEKLLHDQEQSALKRKTLELEMQALRAQMNPHFIFNCLSAIDNLVQTNQVDKATSYLSRFAKLIRSVLDSSKNNLVSFQRDFDTLKLYLEMEKFRCNNKFSYELRADEKLLNGDYKVPPLIIQPFVENAIHHGLLNKPGSDRRLTINAELKDEQIIYQIHDNGIGRKQAAILKNRNRPEHQSYGIEISRERVNLYNRSEGSGIEILDLEIDGRPSGTRAFIKINS